MGLLSARSGADFWNTDGLLPHGQVRRDGDLAYTLISGTCEMVIILRKGEELFSEALAREGAGCEAVVNGNFYAMDTSSKVWSYTIGRSLDAASVRPEGQVVIDGAITAGDSRPESFHIAQRNEFGASGLKPNYVVRKGNPPIDGVTRTAVGGVGPLLVNDLRYGLWNLYDNQDRLTELNPDNPAHRTLMESLGSGGQPFQGYVDAQGGTYPAYGEPSPRIMAKLTQRSNATMRSFDEQRGPRCGKSFIAYHERRHCLLVGAVKDAAAVGVALSTIAEKLAEAGFDEGAFLDGSDSATLMVRGELVVSPGKNKNEQIPLGIGFRRAGVLGDYVLPTQGRAYA